MPFQSQHEGNVLLLVITIIEVFYAFAVLLMACELGQRISVAFDECSAMIDEFKWYLFPTKVQRILPIIINFTQQPVKINCFGSVAADRETFKYVGIENRIVEFSISRLVIQIVCPSF